MCSKRILNFLGCNELLTDKKLWQALIGEFLGTLLLVLIGCGTCITETQVAGIALAFGLSVATMVQCICHVSGGHINPAVTLGMLATCKITLIRALFYIISQCVGAIVGAALLKAVTPIEKFATERAVRTLGLTMLGTNVTVAEAFGVEFLITFILVFTVSAVCDSNRTDFKGSAPLAIGLAVVLCHLFAVKYTGSSMNPARTFGPALITNIWTDHWVYWVGPCLGGIGAAVVYHFALRAPAPPTINIRKDTIYNKDEKFLQGADL